MALEAVSAHVIAFRPAQSGRRLQALTRTARLVLDEAFGKKMFRSEIIWHYRRWSNSQRTLLPAHQNIYFYSKTDHYEFHEILQEYSPTTNVDQILQKRARDQFGKSAYARDEDGAPITDGYKKGVPLSDVWDIPFLNPKGLCTESRSCTISQRSAQEG